MMLWGRAGIDSRSLTFIFLGETLVTVCPFGILERILIMIEMITQKKKRTNKGRKEREERRERGEEGEGDT